MMMREVIIPRLLRAAGSFWGKVPGIWAFSEFVYWKFKPRTAFIVRCQGSKMYVDPGLKLYSLPLLLTGVDEPYTTELFKRLITPNMTIVDVGACVGYYTLLAARLLKNTGKVYAFEPSPENYELLVKSIRENHYANVVTIRKAVSRVKGETRLFLDGSRLGFPSLSESNVTQKGGFVEVETTTLDHALLEKPNLIKIDCQGAEGLVIDGAQKILEANSKIIMEFWPVGIKRIGTDPARLLHKLQKLGFAIRVIDEEQMCLKRMDAGSIVRDFAHDSINLFLERL